MTPKEIKIPTTQVWSNPKQLDILAKDEMGNGAILRHSIRSPFDLSLIEKSANQRDLYTCQFCGFHTDRNQAVIASSHDFDNLDELSTACAFCHAYTYSAYDFIDEKGKLIKISNYSQVQIHKIARAYYHACYTGRLDEEFQKKIEKALDDLHQQAIKILEPKGVELTNAGAQEILSLNTETCQQLRWFPPETILYIHGHSILSNRHKLIKEWGPEEPRPGDRFSDIYPLLNEFLKHLEINAIQLSANNDTNMFLSILDKFDHSYYKAQIDKFNKNTFEILFRNSNQNPHEFAGTYRLLNNMEKPEITIKKIHNLLVIMNGNSDIIPFTNLTNSKIIYNLIEKNNGFVKVVFSEDFGNGVILDNAVLELKKELFQMDE